MPSEIPESIPVDLAKTLVKDIRDFSLQATYENSEEISVAQELQSALDFVDNEEINRLNFTLDIATQALKEAYEKSLNEEISSYTFRDYDHLIPVSISSENHNYVYSINGLVNSIAINLEAESNGTCALESEQDPNMTCGNYGNTDNSYIENSVASFDIHGSLDSEFEMNITMEQPR